MTKFEREHQLIFCIARRNLNNQQQSILRDLLSKSPDWQYVIDLADSHGLLSLLHHQLLSVADLVPNTVALELQNRALINSQTVLSLVAELLKLQRSFDENCIAIASFKGPLLSQLAFGDMALRPAGDIDLLISQDNFHKGSEVLTSMGYRMTPALSRDQLRSHLSFHCEIPFVSEDSRTVVDLHWELAPASFVLRFAAADLWSRLQRVTLAGMSVRTFGDEDLILYLSMHGAKHLWRRLEWIASLAEVLRRSQIDWHAITNMALTTCTMRMLALGVRLAEVCFDVTVPAEVWRRIDVDNSMKQLAEEIKSNILYWPVTEPHSTETALYNLKIMDRKSDALISMMRALYIPTLSDFEAVALPGSLHALYYALRPIRLSRSYTARAWQHLVQRN